MKKLLPISMAIFATLTCQADPLENVRAYSTEITAQGPTDDYFPMGLLLRKDKSLITRGGFNYNEESAIGGCKWKDGKPIAQRRKTDPYGTLMHKPLWAVHYYNNNSPKIFKLKKAVKANGKTGGFSLFDPNFMKYLKAYETSVVNQLGKARGKSEIIFWSIDNEWTGYLDYSEPVIALYHKWLEESYGHVEKLNKTWGSNYKTFSEIKPLLPKARIRKDQGAWLDWHRFNTNNFTNLIATRFKTIHESDPLKRPVLFKMTQLGIEPPTKGKEQLVDFDSMAEKIRPYSGGYCGIDIYGADDKMSYNINYIFNCIRPLDKAPGYGTMLCESNNHSGPAYQWASTYWRALNNGLKGANFFCAGFLGAKGDFDTYAFMAPNLKLRDRFFYAIRWAHMIHRTEAFWTKSVPASGMPKLAMLMPKRDIILADNPENSVWEWERNNRYKVYKRLREQGFWIDTIPYTKLNADYLKSYDALLLVGAQHLTKKECTTISNYVKSGGKLVSDTRPGFFNEHHVKIQGLAKVIGTKITYYNDEWVDLWVKTKNGIIRGDGLANLKLTTGKIIGKTTREQPLIVENNYGKGKSLYIATQLGVLRPETVESMLIGKWMKKLLTDINIKPGYTANIPVQQQMALRVAQPYIDSKDNCIFAITNMSRKPITNGQLKMWLPARTAIHALWAPAENNGIHPVTIRSISDNEHIIDLPEIKTAGMIYLLKDHKPILGIPQIPGSGTSVDKFGATFKPGETVHFTVQLYAPQNSSSGEIKIQAMQGWKITPESIKTGQLKAGKLYTYKITAQIPNDPKKFIPHQIYPLVATWSDGKEKSVITANIEVIIPDAVLDRQPHILSDNAEYPKGYYLSINTGADYKYEAPAGVKSWWKDSANSKSVCGNDGALQGGTKPWRNHIAFFKMPGINIVYDLKKVYNVSRIKLVASRYKVLNPEKITILVSTDGKNYTQIAQSEKINNETEINFKEVPARYVKLEVKFKKNRGEINEIEIWGTKHAQN